MHKDTNKPCRYCGKPFEEIAMRGDAEGSILAGPLAKHESNCPHKWNQPEYPQSSAEPAS